MLSYSGGEVDVGVTGSVALLGTALAPDAVSESEHTVPVIINADAIYAVADPGARTEGATLDIVGATGRQGVAPSINADLVVVQDSAAGEKTLVRIKPEQWVPHHHKAGGPLNAAIARAVVHIHHDRIGRGPTKAQAFYRNEVVVVILQDAMTTSERTLVAAGKGEAVLATRRALEEVIRPDLISAVEQLTGCKVRPPCPRTTSSPTSPPSCSSSTARSPPPPKTIRRAPGTHSAWLPTPSPRARPPRP